MSEVEEIESESVDMVSVLRSDLNDLRSMFESKMSEMESRFASLSADNVTRGISEEVQRSQVILNDFTKEIKESIESLKNENQVLRSQIEEYGNKPSSSIAQQIIPQMEERSLTKEDILLLASAGKLSPNTLKYVREAQLKSL